MVEIHCHYEGGLRCESRHGPSGSTLATDAPRDNMGKGEAFSPTDLMATALGTCMLTTMGIVAAREGWNVDGVDVRVHKHMTAAPPRRIARLEVVFATPEAVRAGLDAAAKQRLEETAHGCPVRISLLPAIDVPVTFDW
ncbi:MAG: OsmC family protein [Myxococcales bacterium]|nr:OsmC family protein [Myxococcales bacterium]